MALNFPSSPTNKQQYTDANAVIWEHNGIKCNVITGYITETFSEDVQNILDKGSVITIIGVKSSLV